MYSRKTWGGPVEPHILVKFLQNTAADDSDPIASMIIFEWSDYDLVGIQPPGDAEVRSPKDLRCLGHNLILSQREYICDPEAISNGWCNSNQTGQFLLAENATELSTSLIITQAVHLKNPGLPVNYEVKKTGYYCVSTGAYTPADVEYAAIVEFRNAYGELPAAQIAKLPFYGGITIVYAVIGV
jgi:hypothetical protein